MKTVYTDKQFIEILEKCLNANTPYGSGGFGACISSFPNQLERYSKNTRETCGSAYEAKLRKASETAPCWCFDCCGLIKSIIWGFDFRTDKTYGGAVYTPNPQIRTHTEFVSS